MKRSLLVLAMGVALSCTACAGGSDTDKVNGSISVAAGQPATDVSTVNGADIKGKLSNVNGDISLDSAHIGGGIETTAADITITGSSKVEGGIHVQKPSGMNFGGNNKVPKIVIGPGATVTGALDFEREVELHVSDRATIGAVRGATVQKFSGDTP